MIPLDRSPRGACIFQRILPKEKKCWRADGWWKAFDARGRCCCRVDRIAVRRQSVRLLFSSDPTACYWRSSDRLEPSDNEIGLIGSPFSLYSPNSHAADQTAEKYGRESRDWSVSKTHCHSKTILCNLRDGYCHRFGKMMTRLLISVIRSSSFTDWETRGKKPFTACHWPHLHIVKSYFIFGTQEWMGFDTCWNQTVICETCLPHCVNIHKLFLNFPEIYCYLSSGLPFLLLLTQDSECPHGLYRWWHEIIKGRSHQGFHILISGLIWKAWIKVLVKMKKASSVQQLVSTI